MEVNIRYMFDNPELYTIGDIIKRQKEIEEWKDLNSGGGNK